MTTIRKLVMIESPFRGANKLTRCENLSYLRAAIADSLLRGEAPFAMHGFYPWYLDDENEAQRELGITCGLAWMQRADLVAFYTNRGISPGMKQGLEFCVLHKLPWEERKITWPR